MSEGTVPLVHTSMPSGLSISRPGGWINHFLVITIHLIPVLFNLCIFACSAPHKITRFLNKLWTALGLKTITVSLQWKQLNPQVLYLRSTLSQQVTSTEKAPCGDQQMPLLKTYSEMLAVCAVVHCTSIQEVPLSRSCAWFKKIGMKIKWVKPFWKEWNCCKYIQHHLSVLFLQINHSNRVCSYIRERRSDDLASIE